VIHYITAVKERKPVTSDQLDFNSFKWELNNKENPLMRRCPLKGLNYCSITILRVNLRSVQLAKE
jgi:hypothetical protein